MSIVNVRMNRRTEIEGARGAAAWLGLMAMGLAGMAARVIARETVDGPRQDARDRLAQVKIWGCQYQKIEPPRIAASMLDLIVVDPVLDGVSGRIASRNEVAELQVRSGGGTRLALAYLAVGAAEEYRAYWQPSWRSEPPEWLGPSNPDWPLSYSVRYWMPWWRAIVADGVRRIAEAGFDGVFLDRVDGFHDWPNEGIPVREAMADFIVELASIARAINPGFLLIAQNAEPLLLLGRYVAAIDGVSKESLLTGLQGAGMPNRADQIEWSLAYLEPAREAGLTMLAIEYVDDEKQRELIASNLRAMGFVAFFGTRLLDRLPL